MIRLKSSMGFSVVETLLILIVIGILGFTGWFVYHSRQVANKDYSSQSATQTTTTKKTAASVDPYAGWKQYCSDFGGVCFKYPQDWQLSNAETSDPNVKNATLLSPTGKIEIIYNPLLDGIGGVCEPDLCFFKPSSIAKPVASKTGTLKVVKGVYNNKDAQVILPYYYISDDSSIAKYDLSVGTNTDVGFFVSAFSNPTKDGRELLYVRDVKQAGNGYDSVDAANAWFSQDEVITAGKILNSIGLE